MREHLSKNPGYQAPKKATVAELKVQIENLKERIRLEPNEGAKVRMHGELRAKVKLLMARV